MKLFTQSLTVLGSIALVILIVNTPLIEYVSPILGVVILFSVIYVILMRRAKKGDELFIGSNPEVFTVVLTVLLAIFITGGINSSLFFLLYFLLFGIVFLFEPESVGVLLLGLLAVFFPSLSEGDLFSNLVKMGSLVFLAPIAYFFGNEFKKRERLERKIRDKTGQIIEDAETLKKHTTSDEAIDELEDIEEKAKQLRNEDKE